jgi:PAS domain S-box-containing protein
MPTQETRQLEFMWRVSSLLSTLDIDRVLSEVVKLTTEMLGASKGSFFLLDDQGKELTLQRFLSNRNYDPDTMQRVSTLILEGGLAGWVMEKKDVAVVEDTLTDSRWLIMPDAVTQGARSALSVPFMVEGRVFGILTLEHPEPGHFREADRRLAQAVTNQVNTAMRNAQLFDRVQSQQRELSAVLDSTTEALFTVDRDGRLGLINAAAEEVLGLRGDTAVNHLIEELMNYSPLLSEIIKTMRDQGYAGGRQNFEIADTRTKRDYVVSVSVVNAAEVSQQLGYVVSLHDVSSLKDLSRLKTHLLHMASHDLKNPLGVLLGYLDMMREDASNGIPPDPSFVDSMLRAVQRMEELIQTLLSQERIEAQGETIRQRVDPVDLLQSVMEDMMASANHKEHVIDTDIGDTISPLSCDPVEMREAMGNLVSNAIKYTPQQGTITIRMSQEDNRLYFSVVDTGLGIPLDQQNMIFNKYFRAKTAATEKIEGTGLGLSLVKTVVEAHGGKVWFQSEEGVGSTFGFWLPVLT